MDANTQRLLRRLAIAGRWEDVRMCLNTYLQQNPQDTETKEELQRLDNGIPLRLMMSAAERREAAVKDARKEIEWLIDDHPIEQIRLLNRDELNDILASFTLHAGLLKKHGISLTSAESMYQRAIKKRLRDFSGRKTKRVLLRAICVIGAIFALGGICYTLSTNAHTRHKELIKALQAPDCNNLIDSIREAKGGINRFFCPAISETINRAELRLKNIEKHYNALNAQLASFELGKKKLSDLTPAEIAQIETNLDTVVPGREQLRKRWQDLCLRQYNELVTHQEKIRTELEQPIPPLPEMTGDWSKDALLLSDYKDTLSQRLVATEAAIRLYGLSSDIPAEIRNAIGTAQQKLREQKHLQQVLKRLSACKSYMAYQKALNDFNPACYEPAASLTTIKQLLPSEADINLHVAAPGGRITGALLATAGNIYMKGGPSFTPAFPPTQETLMIPEDLFTAPSYQYKVYTLKLSDTETWYSTIQPQLDKTNFISYRRSSIDPAFKPDAAYREFQNDDTFELGEIDATELLLNLKIERNTFFIRTNIPDLLTKVLNYPPGKHPDLAQAYLYRVLLQLTREHPYPLLSGVRFSPTLKAHSASFVEVMKRQKIDLKPGCWLSTAAEVRRANQAFADWFATHCGHNYRAEMASNFSNAYSATARFSGYIDENGSIKFCRSINKNEKIWYISQTGIKQGIFTEKPQDALLLTPLFTAEYAKP